MERCGKHGRFGCTDRECQHDDETVLHGGEPAIQLGDAPPDTTGGDATTTDGPANSGDH